MPGEKHITEPDNKGFQVRIVRNKKEYSRYFAHRQWGSRKKALDGAISWRDQQLVLLGKASKYLSERSVISTKKTTGIRGVSRSVQHDKRRDAYYLVYSVHWRKGGKACTKTFHVGRVNKVTADEEFHAFRTAVRFRREYEMSKADDAPFDTEHFKQWRKVRLYESPEIEDVRLYEPVEALVEHPQETPARWAS
ncbi:hypothetical protein ACFL2V_11950 [Pseudomonadota bacterium]